MNLNGFISIDRKILEWEWYLDINTKVLFLHCLIMANWKDGRFMGHDIPRGSFVTSLPQLAAQTNLSIRNVRTALSHLKATGELTVKAYSKFSVITVNNYSEYQDTDRQATDKRQADDRQTAGKRQASDRQATTIEQYNNITKEQGNKETREQSLHEGFEGECKAIGALYNEIYLNTVKERFITDKQRALLGESLKYYNMDDFKEVFRKARASEFLRGEGRTGFKASFEWLISVDNMQKVLDGNYDDKEEGSQHEGANELESFYDMIGEWVAEAEAERGKNES